MQARLVRGCGQRHLQNGLLPHAYYYKALTAFSVQTGGIVAISASYECYDEGQPPRLGDTVAVQGRRALPDTKEAQMRLQNEYGSRNSRS